MNNDVKKNFTKLFFIAVMSFAFQNNISCMTGSGQQNNVPNKNVLPDYINSMYLDIGISQEKINRLTPEQADLLTKFLYLSNAVSMENLILISNSFVDFYKACYLCHADIAPYINKIILIIIGKKNVIANWNISEQEKQLKLNDLYNIYNFFGQYGAKIDNLSCHMIRGYFSIPSLNQLINNSELNICADKLIEDYRKFGMATHDNTGFLPSYFPLAYSKKDIGFCKQLLIKIFTKLSYYHPEYLKKLGPVVASRENLLIMPDKDKVLIELFEFLSYQLDIFKRPENMQSIFDENGLINKNFDISKFFVLQESQPDSQAETQPLEWDNFIFYKNQ